MIARCAGCDCANPAPQGAPDFAIVAHGQPGDPGALQPELEALAAVVAALLPARRVLGATLACPRSLAALAGVGAVYPLFMAGGWFVNSEMPRRLNAAGVAGYKVLEPLGLDPALPRLARRIAEETARAAGLDPPRTTLVVAGHGSSKSTASADSTRAFAAALPPGFARVVTGFIEEPPFLNTIQLDGPALCVPFFATNGEHTKIDIPEAWTAIGAPGPIAPPIGTTPDIPALVAASLRVA